MADDSLYPNLKRGKWNFLVFPSFPPTAFPPARGALADLASHSLAPEIDGGEWKVSD